MSYHAATGQLDMNQVVAQQTQSPTRVATAPTAATAVRSAAVAAPSSQSNTTIAATMSVAKPACLSLDQVKLLGFCFSPTAPPGVDQGLYTQACAVAKRDNLFALPYCPGAESGLLPIPACLDATWYGTLSYCEQYPAADGPDPSKNAICWAARKAPSYYAQVKATPKCGPGATVPVDMNVPPPPATKEEAAAGEPNYMLWGGLALLLVAAGGGIYYYAKKG